MKYNLPSLSLRIWLSITLFAALLPVLFFALVQTLNALIREHDIRVEQLGVESRFIAKRVDQEIDRVGALMRALDDEEARGQDCISLYRYIDQLVPAVTLIMTSDISGEVQCSAPVSGMGTQQEMKWLDRFEDGKDIIRTEAAFGERSNTYIVGVVLGIRDRAGALVQLTSASIDIGMLADIAVEYIRNEEIQFALADADGRVYNHPVLTQIPIDAILQSSLRDRLELSEDLPGRYIAIATPIADTGLYEVLYRSSPSFWTVVRSQPFQIIFIPFLAFASAILALWWSIESLVLKWIRRLQRVIDIYGAGRLGLSDAETISRAPTEIANLATGLDDMADRIQERQDQLSAALKIRDAAVKETHHRVKNNLQIVSSFLNLEARTALYDETKLVLGKARNRISALSIVHQTLYQHERLEEIHTKPFLELLLPHLQSALLMDESGISLTYDIEDAPIDTDDANPLALLILELITNSVKHAFQGNSGEINVSLRSLEDVFELTVSDNGVGKDSSGKSEPGTGSRLIDAFVRQLKGEMEVETEGGRTTRIRFAKKIE